MTDESRSVVVRLSMEASQYIAEAQKVGTLGATAMSKVEGATRRAGASVDDIGRIAGRASLLAAAGLGVIILASARFDKSMSAVQAATHETAGNMGLLRQAALDAGRDTVYSATESAGAIEELAKAGIQTRDIIGGGLTGALNLASAGNIGVQESAELAASAMNQFNLAGSDVPHIADLMAAAAGKAQGGVHELGAAFNQSALVASQMGLSIEETTASLAAFASQGLIGSDAGTSFKTMLLALNPQTTKAKNLMDELGFSAYDAQGQFVGMEALAGRLQDALAGMSDQQRSATLQTLFGRDAIRAANALYEEGAGGIRKWTTAVNDQGYAAETAATRLDNLSGDLEKLRGSLETAFIGAGEGSQGQLRGIVQGVTAIVNAFTSLPPVAQSSLTALLAIGTLTGGGIWLGTKVIGKVSSLNNGLNTLAQTSPKTARGLRLVAAAGAGFAALEIAGDIIATIEDRAAGAAPKVEELTAALIAANQADFEKSFGAGLADNLDALNQAGIDGIAQDLNNLADKGGAAGKALELGLGTIIGQTSRLSGVSVETQKAAESFTSLDAALAGLVASGGPDRARAAFDSLTASQGLSVDQQHELLKLLPGYTEALAGSANAATLAAEGEDKAAGATQRSGRAHKLTAAEVKKLQDAYQEELKAARGIANQFLDLSANADKAKVSLREWIHQMEQQAAALRNFTANAKEAADKGLRQGLIDALEQLGPVGALRMKQLANATHDEIVRANKAWKSGQDAADAYVDATTKVPKELRTKVNVDDAAALAAIAKVAHNLGQMDGTHVDTYVTTHYTAVQTAGYPGANRPPPPPKQHKRTLLGPNHRGLAGSFNPRVGVDSGVGPVPTLPGDPGGGGPVNVPGLPGTWPTGHPMPGFPIWDFQQAVRHAFHDLVLTLADGAKSIRDELQQLRSDLKDAGGAWDDAMRRHAHKIIELAKQYDAQAAVLSQQQQVLEDLTGGMQDLLAAQASFVSSVRANFTHDPFGKGLSGFFLQAGADTNDAGAFLSVLQQLASMGLDGPAFQALAASGDINTAQELAASGMIDAFEAAIGNQASALGALGGFAGDQGFGAQIVAQNNAIAVQTRATLATQGTLDKLSAAVDRQEKLLRDLTHIREDVKAGTYQGAYRGTKDAIAGRDAQVAVGRR